MASMGVYIFNWKLLRQALKEDEKDKESSYDFGKNIIPKMLNEGRKVGLVSDERYNRFLNRKSNIENEVERLKNLQITNKRENQHYLVLIIVYILL